MLFDIKDIKECNEGNYYYFQNKECFTWSDVNAIITSIHFFFFFFFGQLLLG